MVVISHMNIYFTIKVSLCLIAKDNIHLLNTFKNDDEYHYLLIIIIIRQNLSTKMVIV